jgi:hypothetical protein
MWRSISHEEPRRICAPGPAKGGGAVAGTERMTTSRTSGIRHRSVPGPTSSLLQAPLRDSAPRRHHDPPLGAQHVDCCQRDAVRGRLDCRRFAGVALIDKRGIHRPGRFGLYLVLAAIWYAAPRVRWTERERSLRHIEPAADLAASYEADCIADNGRDNGRGDEDAGVSLPMAARSPAANRRLSPWTKNPTRRPVSPSRMAEGGHLRLDINPGHISVPPRCALSPPHAARSPRIDSPCRTRW